MQSTFVSSPSSDWFWTHSWWLGFVIVKAGDAVDFLMAVSLHLLSSLSFLPLSFYKHWSSKAHPSLLLNCGSFLRRAATYFIARGPSSDILETPVFKCEKMPFETVISLMPLLDCLVRGFWAVLFVWDWFDVPAFYSFKVSVEVRRGSEEGGRNEEHLWIRWTNLPRLFSILNLLHSSQDYKKKRNLSRSLKELWI